MYAYITLKNLFFSHKGSTKIVILAIDYGNHYWAMDERAEDARKILISLDKYVEIGDQYFDVIWTQEVLAELAELASECGNVIEELARKDIAFLSAKHGRTFFTRNQRPAFLSRQRIANRAGARMYFSVLGKRLKLPVGN